MEKLIKILKNKYVLILTIFLVWIVFFDQDNLIRQFRLSQDLNEAKDQNEYYSSEFKKDSTLLFQLENDPEVMEKFAREKYKMKRPKEKVFIVVEKEEN